MTTFLRKMWRNHSKHKKLSEEWALAECEGEGWWREARETKTGDVRYAGVTPVERAASAPATALAVRSALHSAKTLNRKLQRVNLDISAKGIVVTDADTDTNVLSISIYKISYCSADAANARVFAVVEGRGSEHVAHVFSCARSRHARALALSLAHAFTDAYQLEGRGNEHVAHVFSCARSRHARALALSLAHAFTDAYQAWQSLQGSSLQSSAKHSSPWERFPLESDEEEEVEDKWHAQAPLVTFA